MTKVTLPITSGQRNKIFAWENIDNPVVLSPVRMTSVAVL